MPVSTYVHSLVPLSEVAFRWEPDEVARIFEVATLHDAPGGSEAGLVHELIMRNQILEPLALIGAFAAEEVASGVNAISGEGKHEHAPKLCVVEGMLLLAYQDMVVSWDFELRTPLSMELFRARMCGLMMWDGWLRLPDQHGLRTQHMVVPFRVAD